MTHQQISKKRPAAAVLPAELESTISVIIPTVVRLFLPDEYTLHYTNDSDS